jgi:hypothetical protein
VSLTVAQSLVNRALSGQSALAFTVVSVVPWFASPVQAQVACPAQFRVNNVGTPNAPSLIDVVLRTPSTTLTTVANNVGFRGTSGYAAGPTGEVTASIFQTGTTNLLGEINFTAAPNTGYTIGYTGTIPYAGPAAGETPSPSLIAQANSTAATILVASADLSTPILPGNFRGQWFRWSETAPTIDFAAQLSSTTTGGTDYNIAQEAFRLSDLPGKGVFSIPTVTAGTYDFNPFLIDSTTPLLNSNFDPPVVVGLRNANVTSGAIFDVFAGGASLLSPPGTPNTLQLTSTLTTTSLDSNGCVIATSIAGPASQAIPEPSTLLGLATAGLAYRVARRRLRRQKLAQSSERPLAQANNFQE